MRLYLLNCIICLALSLLSVSCGNEQSAPERARYALLRCEAADRTGSDSITYDMLRPAIDYYLQNGIADEKLRTRYYEGLIYLRQHNVCEALRSFTYALDAGRVTDSLTVARILSARGKALALIYQYETSAANRLEAAALFNSLGDTVAGVKCLADAFESSIEAGDRQLCDSVRTICSSVPDKYTRHSPDMAVAELAYTGRFGDRVRLKALADSLVHTVPLTPRLSVELARAYLISGELATAREYLLMVPDSIRQVEPDYFLALSEVAETSGDYHGMAEASRSYSVLKNKIDRKYLTDYVTSAERHHNKEVRARLEADFRANLTWGIVVCVILLVLVSFYFHRSWQSATVIGERQKREKEQAQEDLERQREVAERLRLRLSELEKKATVGNDEEATRAFRDQLQLLTGLLAGQITNNERYSAPFDQWIEQMKSQPQKFMDELRLMFKVSHPAFISYLEEHGLTETEINYLCLYAIGLRGKEVGDYMKLRRHYVMSSEIRRKLGIDIHDTNIGIYIRRKLKEL